MPGSKGGRPVFGLQKVSTTFFLLCILSGSQNQNISVFVFLFSGEDLCDILPYSDSPKACNVLFEDTGVKSGTEFFKLSLVLEL